MNYDKLTKEQLLGIHKDTLKYLNEQEQEVERLKEEYMILQNASDEIEEELKQRLEDIEYFIKQRCNENISEIESAMLQSIALISNGTIKVVRDNE